PRLRWNPRLCSLVIEEGSWIEDDDLQAMWSGVLASSGSEDGKDDGALLFVRLLKSLTATECRILKFLVNNAYISRSQAGGLLSAGEMYVDKYEVMKHARTEDVHRLDRELDHLRTLGLLHGGLELGSQPWLNLTPSALALHFLSHCEGSSDPV